MSRGADIQADDECALRWASGKGYLDIVRFLVEQDADLHADNDLALQLAAKNGHLEVIKFLVERGADIHADDECALRWAALNGKVEVVEFLLEKGAPIAVAKQSGRTYAFKDFCKAYELRKVLGQKLEPHAPNKSKSPKLKI